MSPQASFVPVAAEGIQREIRTLNNKIHPLFLYICSPHIRVVAQPGSALVWGARGRWFESSPPDTKLTRSGLFF